MSDARVTFLGSGDSFGSGGRLPACVLLDSGGRRMLLDCGPAVLPGLRRAGVDPAGVELVAISHLHGDHFGGLAFLLLDAYFSRRTAPLVIAGPRSVEPRTNESLRVLFPGFEPARWPFPLSYRILAPREPAALGGFELTAIPVEHVPETEPSALRVRTSGRTIAYSGDSTWCPGLVEAARGADLFVCEASSFEDTSPVALLDSTVPLTRGANRGGPVHISYRTLASHRDELGATRVVLTHAGADVVARRGELAFALADDGMATDV